MKTKKIRQLILAGAVFALLLTLSVSTQSVLATPEQQTGPPPASPFNPEGEIWVHPTPDSFSEDYLLTDVLPGRSDKRAESSVEDNTFIGGTDSSAVFTDCTAVADVSPAECYALEGLFNSNGGLTWDNNDNWLISDEVCTWNGISCDAGHVISIDLYNNNLTGYLGVDFSGFTALTYMDLGYNNLSGDMPTIFSHLPTSLEVLGLDYNSFDDIIPAGISSFTNLYYLGIWGNQVSGDMATLINNLPTSLMYLYLAYNQFTGTIPAGTTSLTSLLSFWVAGNQLNGDFDTILGYLPTGLWSIGFSDNQFTGTIPSGISSFTNLSKLHIAGNQLVGDLPTIIDNLPTSLTELHLDDNQFTGTLPGNLSNLVNLQRLNLGDNQLDGDIASIIASLSTGLVQMDLYWNQFTGTVPASLASLTLLKIFNIGGNAINGDFTTVLGYLPLGLTDLYVNSTNFTGTITSAISSYTSLTGLDVTDTMMTGDIPTMLGYLPTSLQYLQLGWNDYTGTIPSTISSFTNLWSFGVSGNLLTGDMATIFGYLPAGLEYLYLDTNGFTGTIPGDIVNLTGLRELDVSDNNLSGSLSDFFYYMPTTIQRVNLRWNNFSGEQFSSFISGWSNLVYFNVGGNQLAGDIFTFLGWFPTSLEYLYLYDNQITGTVPSSLSGLTNLIVLNLGGNQIMGNLSTTIGYMTSPSLQGLGLYWNEFFGTVPASIGAISNLAWFSVEGNGLTGDLGTIIGYMPAAMEMLYLDWNDFTGNIPASISSLTILSQLSISHNTGLSGTVPLDITSLSLDWFDFSTTPLCEPVDAGYDTWKAGVADYYAGVCGAVATENDYIAEAFEVDIMPYSMTVDSRLATLEDGEPDYTCGSNIDFTVWYTYSPSSNGYFVVDTLTSDFDTVIHVFQVLGGGSYSLTGCDDDGLESGLSQVAVYGYSATTYLIGIGGNEGDSGISAVHVYEADPFSNCGSVDVPTSECNALADFYMFTDGPLWTNHEGWFENNVVCTWYGIDCSGGRVSSIYLKENNLVGTLNTDFSSFDNMTIFNVGDNSLDGDMASIVAKLPVGLEEMYLRWNNITGTIPWYISTFTNLKQLHVGGNELDGDIATILPDLPTSLELLYLYDNSFTGTVPSDLTDLTNLVVLNISDNSFTGDIGTIINYIDPTDVVYLLFSNNNFTGSIPDTISDFNSLVGLFVDNNAGVTGPVPLSITSLPLENFHFDGTDICEPDDAGYASWKATISDYLGTDTICVSMYLFQDDFETNDFSLWTRYNDGNGWMYTCTEAAVNGTYGACVERGDNDKRKQLIDDSPVDQAVFAARFSFDINSLSMGQGERFRFMQFKTGPDRPAFLVMIYSSGTYYIQLNVKDDAGVKTKTGWIELTDEVHTIEVDWAAATSNGANDGFTEVYIDDVLQEAITGLDNDTWVVESYRMGFTSRLVGKSISGIFYIDDVATSNTGHIGLP